jgi:hypothetical protein
VSRWSPTVLVLMPVLLLLPPIILKPGHCISHQYLGSPQDHPLSLNLHSKGAHMFNIPQFHVEFTPSTRILRGLDEIGAYLKVHRRIAWR